MNDGILVNLAANFAGIADFQSVVIRSSNVEDLVNACEALGDRVCGVELHGGGLDVSPLGSLPVGLPLLWKLPASNASEIYTHTWMGEHFDLGVMIDASKGLFGAVRMVTSAGVPVVLGLDGPIDCADLISVLDYYLHSKYLQVPVEFFHSMLVSRVQGADSPLVNIYPESPERILYIDENGNVSASGRFALAKQFFGRFDGRLTLDVESPLYEFLQNPRKALYLGESSCSWCESFDLCGGYLRFVDSSFRCSPFLDVFKIIKEEAANLANDLSRAQEDNN